MGLNPGDARRRDERRTAEIRVGPGQCHCDGVRCSHSHDDVTIDVIAKPDSAPTTSGGTDAPAPGTSGMFTVTTAAKFPVLASGFVMRVIDLLDQGKTANYEIMEVTANANGTGESWTVRERYDGHTRPTGHWSQSRRLVASTVAMCNS